MNHTKSGFTLSFAPWRRVATTYHLIWLRCTRFSKKYDSYSALNILWGDMLHRISNVQSVVGAVLGDILVSPEVCSLCHKVTSPKVNAGRDTVTGYINQKESERVKRWDSIPKQECQVERTKRTIHHHFHLRPMTESLCCFSKSFNKSR